METVINYVGNLLTLTLIAVYKTLLHNWKVLAISIVLAVGLKTYINTSKFSSFMMRRKKVSIFASVLFGAFTPFCACGTAAVLIGMLTTTLPWGPIMAFLTSSPLMSPDGFVFISGTIGFRFAVALTIASLAIGILSGLITNIIEKNTHYLDGQSRYLGSEKTDPSILQPASCGCSAVPVQPTACACSTPPKQSSCGCPGSEIEEAFNSVEELCSCALEDKKKHDFAYFAEKYKFKEFMKGIIDLGLKQILFFFTVFVAVGYLINYFVPTSIITVLFGARAFYAVPLASLIGLPLYITTESGIPIIKSMMESGASGGAMLAFIITGSATSAWVIAGLSTFMKKRAIILYVAFILLGGIITGYVYDIIQAFM